MNLSKKRGITVTSIVVYVVLFFMFTTAIIALSSRFNKTLFNDRGKAINITAINKLEYNLLNSANNSYNSELTYNGNKTTVTFSNSDEYIFDLDNQIVYKNGGKLVKFLSDFQAVPMDDILELSITLNKYTNNVTREIHINVPVNTYVEDGLIARYDGINNQGTNEHNNVANVWKDLSNNNFNATLTSGITHDGTNGWVENGMLFTNSEGYGSRYAKATIDPQSYADMTFEITMTPTTQFGTGGSDYLWPLEIRNTNLIGLQFGIRDGVQLMYKAGNNTVFVGPSIKKDNRYTLTFVQNDLTTRTLYSNGKMYQTKTGLTLSEIDFATYPYIDIQSDKRGSYIIHSVRVYDRALNEEEIKYNYNIDELRFGE